MITVFTVYLVLRMLQYILCYICYSISRAQVTEIDDDNVDLPLASSGSVLTLQYTINGTKSGRLLLSLSSSKLCYIGSVSQSLWGCSEMLCQNLICHH